MDQTENKPVYGIQEILSILPHRYPFLMVDRVTAMTEDDICAYKNVTVNEPFFPGHFEGNPIMPGVMQLEAMAQVGGILLSTKVEDSSKYWVYFTGIDNAKFRKQVGPGDKLEFQVKITAFKRNICKMEGTGMVDGKLACQAELTAALVAK